MKKPILTVEFTRPIEVARIAKLGSHEKIAADAGELQALAKRFDVPALHGLSSALFIKSWRGGGFKLTGTIDIDLEQVSVVSLEAFRATQKFEVIRYFVTKFDETADEDLDVIENGVIDIGEVVAETVALELDPYPRKEGESFADRIEDDEPVPATVSPFAKLQPKS